MSNKRVKVTLYENKLRLFLNTPNSGDAEDLWKYLDKAKDKALRGARRQVGVKSGALRKNIRAYHLGNFTGQYVGLYADLPYALAHHQGTKPHKIHAREGQVLAFKGRRGMVITESVNHPGTKANPYLSNQLIHFRG